MSLKPKSLTLKVTTGQGSAAFFRQQMHHINQQMCYIASIAAMEVLPSNLDFRVSAFRDTLPELKSSKMVIEAPKKFESRNEIFARRKQKLIVNLIPCDHPADAAHLTTFIRNLQSVGWAASKELIAACSGLCLPVLTKLNDEAINALETAQDGHCDLKPMYPNFPSQVMELSEGKLYLNALLHYLSSGKFFPETDKQVRPALAEYVELKVLTIGSEEEFDNIFTELATANTSLSTQDQKDLAWFFSHYKDHIVPRLPPKIPNREIKALICAELIEHTTQPAKQISTLCDTATDVMRLAVALSKGDISLATPCKFIQFKRPIRKLLLENLENQNNIAEDMLRWKGPWIRLGERLHPGEFRKTFPKTAQAFDTLRNNLPIESFNNKLEKLLERKDTTKILAHLLTRPGDFARRLDHVLRLNPSASHLVLEGFSRVSDYVSTPVLLQVKQHFATRNDTHPLRIFLPKGQAAKAQAIANVLPPVELSVCRSLAMICDITLVMRFAQLPTLGKCYVNPELKNFPIPFSQRSASKSLRTVARGSKLPLPQGDTLRFFLWWKNGSARTDLDLSAVMFDKDFCFVSAITYYNLKDFGGHHSGDIVDAPKGASEFIDVSLEKCLSKGVRYIIMTVNSFTQQPYCNLPECFAGWMCRQEPNSGEIYEPKTVQDKLDLSANTKIAIPAIFDLETKKVIWADLALTQWPYWYNNVASNLWGIQLALKSLVELNKPNLYDLLILHAQARGQLVENENEAQTVFSVKSGTPFDTAKLASEFLQG